MDLDDLLSQPAAPTTKAGGKFRPKSKPHLKKQATLSAASGASVLTKHAEQKLDAQSSFYAVEAPAHVAADKGSADPKGDAREDHRSEIASEPRIQLPGPSVISAHMGGYDCVIEATGVHAFADDNLDERVFSNAETIASPDNTGFHASETYRDSHVSGNDAEEAATGFDLEDLDIISEGPATYGHLTGIKLKPKFKDTAQPGGDQILVKEGSDPASQGYDATNHLTIIVNNVVPPDATAEKSPVYSVGDETSYMDTANILDFVHFEDVPETNGELSSKSQKGKAFAALAADQPSYEEGNGRIGDPQHDSFPEKSKNARQENEKPTQKRKRFSHSTRRKRRALDKELLETPEEEMRYLPIKDMLQLIEYKDWLAKQDAKALGTPLAKESTRTTSNNHKSQNEESFASESNDIQDGINCETSVLNYHSYMNKAPKLKWSKQDTQLFYEGIRQFGTDFSLIQQLFPERLPHQIKLKFNREERQQPLKIHEALTNRAKNFSLFEAIMKKLQEKSAQLARESKEEEEDTTSMSGEEPKEDAAKSEAAAVVEELEDPEDGYGDADSGDHEEEDDYIINSYKP